MLPAEHQHAADGIAARSDRVRASRDCTQLAAVHDRPTPGQRQAGDTGAEAPPLLQHEDDVGLSAEEGAAEQSAGADHGGQATPQGECAGRDEPAEREERQRGSGDHEHGERAFARAQELQGQHGRRGDRRPRQPRREVPARRRPARRVRAGPARSVAAAAATMATTPRNTHRQPAGVGDVRRECGPEQRRQHPGGREAGEDRRPQGRGEDQTDQDVEARPSAPRRPAPGGPGPRPAPPWSGPGRRRRARKRRGPAPAPAGRSGPRRSLQPPAATMPTTPLARGAAKESA